MLPGLAAACRCRLRAPSTPVCNGSEYRRRAERRGLACESLSAQRPHRCRGRRADNLATGANHLLDLRDGRADVGRVGLRHRLDRHGRTTTDLDVLNLNWTRLRIPIALALLRGAARAQATTLAVELATSLLPPQRLNQVVADYKNHQQQDHYESHLLYTIADTAEIDKPTVASSPSRQQEDRASVQHGNRQEVENSEVEAQEASMPNTPSQPSRSTTSAQPGRFRSDRKACFARNVVR